MRFKLLLRFVSEYAFRRNGHEQTTLVRLAEALRNSAARPLPYKALVAS
jgi:hypothetical protein